MDAQALLNTILPIICVGLGWFCQQIWHEVQELKKEHSHFRADMPIQYLRRDEFFDRWEEMIAMLRRIEDKLDSKVDKK
jgi:hypothetical protein